MRVTGRAAVPPRARVSYPIVCLFSTEGDAISTASSNIPDLSDNISSTDSTLSGTTFVQISVVPKRALFAIVPLNTDSLTDTFMGPVAPTLLVRWEISRSTPASPRVRTVFAVTPLYFFVVLDTTSLTRGWATQRLATVELSWSRASISFVVLVELVPTLFADASDLSGQLGVTLVF